MQLAYTPGSVCVSRDDCVVGGHSGGPHGTCVDGVDSYSCDCDPGLQETDIDGEDVCGIIDDCGPNAYGNGNCVDKVNGNTCGCDEDSELMLPVNDSVCVAKECGTFSFEQRL